MLARKEAQGSTSLRQVLNLGGQRKDKIIIILTTCTNTNNAYRV